LPDMRPGSGKEQVDLFCRDSFKCFNQLPQRFYFVILCGAGRDPPLLSASNSKICKIP
jgi:hypothetical protein